MLWIRPIFVCLIAAACAQGDPVDLQMPQAVVVRPPPPDYAGLPHRDYAPGSALSGIEDAQSDAYERCETIGTVTCCAFADGRLYSVFASPLQATVIRLGDDERLLDVVAGDSSANWVIETSEMGAYSVVYVKPTHKRLQNSLTLTTTRERIYTLDVQTVTDGSHNRIFHWIYDDEPGDVAAGMVIKAETANNHSASRASGDDASEDGHAN